ncbi:MAG: hypothetical protein IT355_01430 [Gemmatimonadaceae bacterium]|nr:hypothetical protein [Gemmatimonadaceae bacterium]
MRRSCVESRRTAVALALLACVPGALLAQSPVPECPAAGPDSIRVSGPSIALDAEPGVRYLVGDSVRIGLSLNNAPAGRISFAAMGVDRGVVDAGNVFRWRPGRGMEGANYLTVAARAGDATVACRQVRLTVDRAQRAPMLRISARQVQAGTTLDFMVGATDPDGDSLSYSVTELTPGSPSATVDSTGRFRWRAPLSASSNGSTYQFKVEASDGLNIAAAIFGVTVSGLNVRPECPLTIATVTAAEGMTTVLPMAATDANGDPLRYRPERDLTNARVDSGGYRWEIPYGTVENGAAERLVEVEWRAVDAQNAQSDLCKTRVVVRGRMEPERLRTEQAGHARFLAAASLTGQELDERLEQLRDRINSSDNARRRRSIAALATALLAGTFQLARAEDTRRWAGGANTLTSVFFAGYNALAQGTDGFKSDARKFEDEIAKYSPLLTAFRTTYGETITEQSLRSAQYRADRIALEAEQIRATALMR